MPEIIAFSPFCLRGFYKLQVPESNPKTDVLGEKVEQLFEEAEAQFDKENTHQTYPSIITEDPTIKVYSYFPPKFDNSSNFNPKLFWNKSKHRLFKHQFYLTEGEIYRPSVEIGLPSNTEITHKHLGKDKEREKHSFSPFWNAILYMGFNGYSIVRMGMLDRVFFNYKTDTVFGSLYSKGKSKYFTVSARNKENVIHGVKQVMTLFD
tara:strand:- start:8561 stop:9181 length:621 start_codon:yes stop_codon:yes gene_type:complete